jgi:hypothetical protein
LGGVHASVELQRNGQAPPYPRLTLPPMPSAVTFPGLTPTRYVDVRRRFLREHPGHALDSWPLPAD